MGRASIIAAPCRRAAGAAVMVAALGGCVSVHQQRFGVGEVPTLVGPAVRDNVTPMNGALACFAPMVAAARPRPLVIAVGDVRDYTGKYSVNEGNAVTQGGALMVASALGKLNGAVVVAERFDPTIAERELGYTDRRQLGDGAAHELAGTGGTTRVPWLPYFGGSIAASDFYIVGGITELNYDIRSGGVEIAASQIGPKARSYTQSIAIDLRIVDTRSLLVAHSVSLTKQFTGYEVGFNIFRFFGSDLFDIGVGAKGQEPLQLGIRAALEEAVIRLVGAVARTDPAPCLTGRVQPSTTASRVTTLSLPPRVPAALPATAAVNAPAGAAAQVPATTIELLFDPGSVALSSDAANAFDRIADDMAHAVTVIILASDTETTDPGPRDRLTDHRIAAVVAVLATRGVAPSRVETIWRPASTDAAIHRGRAGQQVVARLRVAP